MHNSAKEVSRVTWKKFPWREALFQEKLFQGNILHELLRGEISFVAKPSWKAKKTSEFLISFSRDRCALLMKLFKLVSKGNPKIEAKPGRYQAATRIPFGVARVLRRSRGAFLGL
jgi:hypothetical protein